MATYKGVDGIIKIGANTVAEVRGWTADLSSAIIETTAKGASARTNKAGLLDAQGSVSAAYFSTDTTGQALMKEGLSVTLILYPEGAANQTITVISIISNLKIDSPLEGDTMASFDFLANGAVVRA